MIAGIDKKTRKKMDTELDIIERLEILEANSYHFYDEIAQLRSEQAHLNEKLSEIDKGEYLKVIEGEIGKLKVMYQDIHSKIEYINNIYEGLRHVCATEDRLKKNLSAYFRDEMVILVRKIMRRKELDINEVMELVIDRLHDALIRRKFFVD